jgi:hypothetical protein
VRRRAPPDRESLAGVGEEVDDGAPDGVGVALGHDDSAPVAEQLACIEVGRGHHRLPRADGVGEGSRRDLGGIEVGRHVDVGSREELGQLGLTDEAVVEDHVRSDAEPLRARFQLQPVALAVALPHVGMRGSEHDVDRVGVPLEDRRQRVDHVLDALVGREQPEGEDHVLAADAELVLAAARGRHVRNAVRDPVDLPLRYAVDLAQQGGARRAHHHDALGEADQLVHRGALELVRRREDRMERRHDRHAQLAQQRQHVAAALAAEDPVLVLHARDVDRVDVQEVRRPAVRGDVAVRDLEADRRRIGVTPVAVVHGEREAVERRECGGDRIA